MKKVKVLIKGLNQLELAEDAKKGDYIDLKDVMEVDTSWILKQIDDAKDKVYDERLEKVLEVQKLKYQQELQLELNKVNNEKNELKHKNEMIENKVRSDLTLIHKQELNELTNKINILNNEKENLKDKIKNEFNEQLGKYNLEINELKNKLNEKDANFKIEKLEEEKIFIDKINELEKTIDTLKRDRSSLNVKTIGESLEIWCDNEMQAHNLVMPKNILWQKDNEVVKGGKADFIYKVYATDARLEDELLTSVILEMKSEDPLAKSKQNIDPILRKLNEDRNNKGIEYAILVSEIDWKDNNDVPIRKVLEYDKMFIVRPPYFITLLNIITSFGLKYQEILLTEKSERIKFKDSEDILAEFEKMKNDILDLSLQYIENNIDEIIKESKNITKANDKLLNAANTILEAHLVTVKNKINNFNINRINRKINNV